MLNIKRIYEEPDSDDGQRILVDRIWPRGVSKENAKLSTWMKEIAPSTELRKWFAHKPGRFAEFGERYEKELGEDRVKVQLDQLRSNMENDTVTLLYGAKDEQHNHAIILKRILERT